MTYIIAEAGVNHNGSLDLALQLVDAAVEAGADCVKFQTFRARQLASARAAKARYQQETTGTSESQVEMLERLELSHDAHRALLAHCDSAGIEFLSSPFDVLSLRFLVEDLGVQRLKLGSGELTNGPLLDAAARTGLPLILSTGMAELHEVRAAAAVVAHAWAGLPGAPDLERLGPTEREVIASRLTVLQCTTEYPAPFDDVNLRAMEALRAELGCAIGFSDHTPGIAMPIAAAALGAVVIEKHLTLDHGLPGPDHRASLEPATFRALVDGVRQVERALGDGVKRPSPSELPNRAIARKSLVAARPIRAGEVLTEAALTAKRPAGGLSPMHYWELLGRPATRSYDTDDALDPAELSTR